MAIAPERTGIGIRRYFTTPGVHPYDTVTWERRDARITNWATGAVAFEQLGVEVPSGWSVNATNILAQKYFRGTLGTPEREWSLKQVVDRVVGTIVAWGDKDGYFADAQEAETFEAELEWLIIHQRAAFNSPVWFNIGVAGVPQQASACQPYGSMVSTPDGLVPIGRLVDSDAVGTKVYDAHGLTSIVAVKANGRKPVLRLQTKAGHALDVTADHLVWLRVAVGTGRFVPAGSLRPGDQLTWHRTEAGMGDGTKTLEIGSIEELGEMDVYDIQTESGEYLSDGLRVHNCFILAVDDSMDSILNWYMEEGKIFKGGSGAGINLSRIRSSQEGLRGGGTASGPVSFMRGADASAGTIKSGGKTRRAAKMVILDASHPDVEDFIWCKAIEERKARALRDAGFDMDLDGKDSHSVQYQNANNSVRVTDEFMQAVLDNKDWELKAVTSGEVLKTMKARDLFRQISKAAWDCADPGMQFDTTINKWHTSKNTGRINASNPCFTGDALVHTDKGLVSFRELFARVNEGEMFAVYTHDATNPQVPAPRLELTTPEALMITGYNQVLKVRFGNGMEVRCTPSHRFFTVNRGYVEAQDLTPDDRVKILDLPAPAVSADYGLPVASDLAIYSTKGDHRRLVRLPEKWDEDLAHYLGWMVGDGSVGAAGTLSAVYGSPEDQAEVLPRHQSFVTWLNGDLAPAPSTQANGTVKLRLTRRPLTAFFAALGLTAVRGPQKRAPWSVFQAPPQIVAAFLRGLFDADGCARRDETKGSYVGLGSTSRELLVDVQRLLTTFGIACTIWDGRGSRKSGFTYRRADGTEVTYNSAAAYDLRITSKGMLTFAQEIGFSLPSKASKLEQVVAGRARAFNKSDGCTRLRDMVEDGFELTYNLSESRNHSYVVNGLVVRNCSEYMHLDNSACNLASINLLTFLGPDDDFDVDGFKAAVEVVFTGQEILVGNADYPTKAIGDTSRRFRQLGLGYANLGALLMAQGIPYDSEAGRAWAGAITALMTGHAYAVSARTAARMGPFAGYDENREPMLEVLRMHRAEVAKIDELVVPPELLSAAQESWDNAVETAEVFGVRNSQASVLAPTGCLVGGSLVPTERGLVRLASLGEPDGSKWQELGLRVATDEGAREASEFYVNGLEPVVTVRTRRGHRLQGTPQHRVKVIDVATGKWEWKRLADMATGDVVPLALDQLIGRPQTVPLPPLPEAYWTGERNAAVPLKMTAELAELVGYFMGDGSLHSRGLRFCVTGSDIDVVERLRLLGKAVFGLEVAVAAKKGYTEVRLDSVRVVLWWEACGFAKGAPALGHRGKGYVAHIPSAVLAANDREIYSAFLRGLYEADGGTSAGYPTFKTTSLELAQDVQSLLLALGYPTNMHVAERTNAWGTLPIAAVRLLNLSWNEKWALEIGFMGDRKQSGLQISDVRQAGRKDYIPLSRELVDRLAPDNDRLRKVLLMEVARGRVSRRAAEELYERTGDAELAHMLGFFYDTVGSAELGEEELTYDLSVPANVTYIANGFVSHNTIGLLMDCDTTGIEPDLGLVKTKKLVGGGTMSIINQTVPRALHRLGYSEDEISDIVSYVDERKSILGAPHISADHLAVFACSMGDNTIHYRGHVRMMAAAQPFLSGAISKTVNMPEEATIEDVEQLHIEAWQLGIKAVAIYRDNCKVAQPLATTKRAAAASSGPEAHDAELAVKVAELEKALELQTVIVKKPVREHMPRKRKSLTFSFRVADCEGYVTVGELEDGRPGEVFMKVSKQGSTLAGIMDAFAISVSLGLQHGVPLATFVRHFTNMRFEPAGMTDDPDLRFAASLVDYIFRRLAVEYMSPVERMDLGILTVSERMQPTLPGVEEAVIVDQPMHAGLVEDLELREGRQLPLPAPFSPPTGRAPAKTRAAGGAGKTAKKPAASDAPYCYQCGVQMQRAGSCFACPSCGTTSGCS